VLANASVSLRSDARRGRAATRLLGSSDPEVRAYGAWLVAFDDDDAPPEARSSAPEDLLLGAVLARHEGLTEVARTLETRAASLALRGRTGPYRG
jgi:hypothetical protein